MRSTRATLLLLALLLPACGPAAGGGGEEVSAERPEGWQSLADEGSATRLYYQFVDAERRVRFVERLEDVPEKWRATVGFVKMDVPPPLSPADAARARRASLGGGSASAAAASGGRQIVLYSAVWCGACKKAKKYLDAKGVAYTVRDVDDPAIAEELLRKTGERGIPVIDVGGRVLTGFSAKAYDALIDSA